MPSTDLHNHASHPHLSSHSPHPSIPLSTLDIQLESPPETSPHTPTSPGHEGPHFSLPRADGGRDAYLVLFSCFMLEALVWGFPFAYGVFYEHYSNLPQFRGQTTSLAAIGTTQTGIMYFGAPLCFIVLKKWPRLRKPFVVGGFVILEVGLVAASFAGNVDGLLATQGVLYAIGGCIHYFPVFLYLDEWFFARKGLAYGTAWMGTGCAGVALPLTLAWLLRHYGHETTLRIWAVVALVLTTPSFFFLKGFITSSSFWIMQGGNIVQGLGYFLPTLYMPSFAKSVGLTSFDGTLAVSLVNGSTIIGSFVCGLLVDRYHVTTAVNICAVGTVVAVFLFWSFAIYSPVLYIFAILYGAFAGGFAATWTGVASSLRSKWPATDTGMIIALFAAGKGLGAVVSGPLSGAIVDSAWFRGGAKYAWGTGYGGLILFSGLTAAATGAGWCGKKAGLVL